MNQEDMCGFTMWFNTDKEMFFVKAVAERARLQWDKMKNQDSAYVENLDINSAKTLGWMLGDKIGE
jgi:hypothetical protein